MGREGGDARLISAADVAFAVAGALVYAIHDRAIVRAPIDGGAREIVRARARGLAVDDETLYWTELDDDGVTVLRHVALPR